VACAIIFAPIVAYGQSLTALKTDVQPVDVSSQSNPELQTKTIEGIGSWVGKKINHIQFDGVSDPLHTKWEDLITLKAGDIFTQSALHQSLQTLYSTGRFTQIEVEAESSADGGVEIKIHLTPEYFIGTVTVSGAPKPPTSTQLENASKLELGTPYRVGSLADAIVQIKQLLHDNGYFKADVNAQPKWDTSTQQVEIDFTVTAGEQARVGTVTVTGDPEITTEKTQTLLKMKAGDRATLVRQQRAVSRLLSHYQKEQHLEAQATMTGREFRDATNTIDYTFHVDRGLPIVIRTEGASMHKSDLMRMVPVFEENAVDTDLLNEGSRNLRDYFQNKGYFHVKVDFNESNDQDGTHEVTFNIDRGESHKVVSIEIKGNRYFDNETLRERLQVAPSTWFLPHGRFSQALLAHDITAIEQLYRSNGFLQVKVTSEVKEQDVSLGANHLAVTYNIEEGMQTRVASLQISGNTKFAQTKLNEVLALTTGQPFSGSGLTADRDSLLSYYQNNGFPEAQVSADYTPDANNTSLVHVRYQIVEGEPVKVGQVLISGLEHTRKDVVQRALRITPGQPLSLTDMLESQRNLYDLGLFNEVKVAVQDPQGDIGEKNVLVDLDEAPRTTFYYGLGLEVQTGSVPNNCAATGCQPQGQTGVSPRVSFDVTRSNLFGTDQSLLFKSRLGRLQQRALVSFISPHFLDHPNLTLTFTSFYDKTQDVFTFTAQRIEASIQLEHRFNKSTTLLYRMTYRRVSVDPNTLQIAPALIPLLSLPVRVAIPSFTWIRDTRDNPIDSKRGMYWTADFGLATTKLGSQTDFARVLLQNSTYTAFKKKTWVFARTTRIGVEVPYGNTTDETIPLPERFYAGGSNSLRGFTINQAGPRDLTTGYPIGGSGLFVNSFELRTPPLPFPYVDENLSMVIFHDAGNVFSSRSQIFENLDKFHQNGLTDFDYMSNAVGAGLRYKTPIGPLRVDFSYNVNPPRFNYQPAPNVTAPTSLSHFNFFFSIGQTF